MPRRRRHWLAVDYNTANPALRVAALAQNATDEPVEATSEVFLLQKGVQPADLLLEVLKNLTMVSVSRSSE